MSLNLWSWWSVARWWKSCHACQVFSDMDGFPFHSISSPHVLMAQHLVYPLKWQCAIFADILAKINFLRSPVHQKLLLVVYQTVLFLRFLLDCWIGMYGSRFSLVQKYCSLWIMNHLQINHLLPKQNVVFHFGFIYIWFDKYTCYSQSCLHLHWCRQFKVVFFFLFF